MSASGQMRVVELAEFGGPERLVPAERPVPEPGEGDVLVRVRACGVCFHDTLVRAGRMPGVTLPRVLGHEFSGEVVAVGSRVRTLRAGDRVAALTRVTCGMCRFCAMGHASLCTQPTLLSDGAYAEYVAMPEHGLTQIPDGVDFESAALAACAIGPSYNGLVTKAHVTPGETVVVTGASGGLGTHALQVAQLHSARTIAVTGSPAKTDALRKVGADEVVVSPNGDFATDVKKLTSGAGADIVVENVGAATIPASLKSLRKGGRLVLLGDLGGGSVSVNPAMILLREISFVVGKTASPVELAEILELLARRRLRAVISERLDLEAAARAHERLAARQAVGRMVLMP
jgi:NADPH:quinone reductase-like Zn-dependent oxidoreductase